MRDVLIGAVTIALGLLLALVISAGSFYLVQPASSVSIDLSQYQCELSGTVINCRRN